MNQKNMIKFVVGMVCSFNLYALVDYTEQEFEKAPGSASSSQGNVRQVESKMGPSSRGSQDSMIRSFSLSSSFESQKVDINDQTKKVEKNNFNLFVQTGFNVFLNASYWMAKSNSDVIAKSNQRQPGNPIIKLGFNWLRFGAENEMMTVDLLGGMMLKGNSDFASSRNDQIVGVETTKRFFDLAFGLGYEYRITGDVNSPEETPVGSMNKFQTALGWKVSPDIHLSLEANYIRVLARDDGEPGSLANKGFTFSYITPKMSLALSRYLGMELGANFQTKKVVLDDSLVGARLWDLQGIYGNSIFAGLAILL